MTPSELDAACRSLYADAKRQQRRPHTTSSYAVLLARDLGMSQAQAFRYLTGRVKVPRPVELAVQGLLKERANV